MKVKVKGLVFVGFAAAILSANAMAADNTVTSKTYVDSKVSASSTISETSTTTAPNEKAVYDALALKADDDTAIKGVKEYGADDPIQPDENGIVELPAAQAVNNGQLSITVNNTTQTFEANQSGNTTFSVTGLEETANKLDGTNGHGISDTNASNEGTAYPSAKAVKDYVTDAITTQSGTDANTYQAKSTGTSVGITGGTWKALGDGTYTTVDDTGNSVTIDVNATADGTLANAGTGGTDAAKIPTANAVKTYVDSKTGSNIVSQDVRNGTTTTAPSEDAVYDFVTDAISTQATADAGTYQAKSTAASIGGTGGTWTPVDTSVTSTGTSVPTTTAVYNAIQAATNGNVIPSMPSTCSKDAPCVLTNSTTDGSLVWVPIQQ